MNKSLAKRDNDDAQGEDRFEAVANASVDGLLVIDGDGIVKYANPSAIAMFSEHAENLVGFHLGTPAVNEPTELQLPGNGDIRYVEIRASELCWKGRESTLAVLRDITERKQAEEVLRQSEQRIQSIFRSAPVGIGIIANRIIKEVNPQLCEITGYSTDELIDQSARLLYPSTEEFEYVGREKYGQIRESGTGTVETRWKRRDGTVIYILLSSTAVDRNDLSKGVTFTALDITKRKQAEEALRENEKKYRNLVEGLNDAVYLMKLPEGRYEYFSSSAKDVFGYTREEFIDNPLLIKSIIHPDYVGYFEDKWKELLEGDVQDKYEYKIIDSEGNERWIVQSNNARFDDAGQLKSIEGLCQNITERKRAEAAEAEQKALLEAIYRNAPLIMMVVNGERRIQQVNGFASQFADRSTEEMRGLHSGEALRCLHALEDPRGCGFGEFCEQCAIRNTVLDTLGNGTTNLQIEADYYPQPSAGRTPPMKLLVSSTPLDFRGEHMALVTMLDITGRKTLENQLRQAQKMESVGRLAGGIAHDFNNLLMGIMNYAEMCRDEISTDHVIREWLDEITNGAQHSANLTRQLLAFARKQTIAPKIVDVNDVISTMLKMIRRLIGEDIDLSWHPGSTPCSVCIDPGQIDQILANLCVNARDAIGGAGRIVIKTGNAMIDNDYCREHPEANPGSYVMLAVSDDGCGMDCETLDMIFEPFYTTKPTGEGTGLGLSTIYGIVKQNEGFVNVFSEPGEGTTFRVYLPVCAEEAARGHKTDADTAMASFAGTETVLVVEDEPAIRRTLQRHLGKLGYTVVTAAAPDEALRLAAEHDDTIDLLITDVVMPGMSGRDLARELMPDHPDMKVLYMSGYTANVIAHRGILEENVQFLAKPFGREDLAKKLREMLD